MVRDVVEQQNIRIPLGDNKFLCVENYGIQNREVFVGVIEVDNNGHDVWYQDLAIVREKVDINEEGMIEWMPNRYEVMVYGDSENEDYTDKFNINEHCFKGN